MRDWTTLRFRSRLCRSTGLTICGLLLAAQTWAQATGEAFVRAAARGDVVSVTTLLGHGTDVDARDRNGNTAVIEAARTGKRDVVNVLIEAGADLDAQNNDGWTAPMRAIFGAQVATLRVLAEAGARMDLVNSRGQTALDLAFEYAGNVRPEILPVLADAGVDVRGATVKGQPALVHAISTLQAGLVTGLLKAGVDPDVRDDQGRPAITLAARKATLESGVKMIALLISAGADVNARDEHDRSPLENAVRISKTEYRKLAVRENVAAAVYALTSRGADDASIAAARWQCRVNDYWLFDRMIRDGRRRAESLSRQQPDPPAER